jgi:hypothetical protein
MIPSQRSPREGAMAHPRSFDSRLVGRHAAQVVAALLVLWLLVAVFLALWH